MNKTYYESDHLAHWKYIKKVRKNGRWVYYYDKDDNELTKLKTEERLRKRVESTAFKRYADRVYKQDLENANKNIKNLPEGPDNVRSWYAWPSTQRRLKEGFHEGRSYNMTTKERNIGWETDWAKRTRENYERTTRGHIDKFMEKNGNKIVKNLNRVSSTVYKFTDKYKNIKIKDLFK